MKLNKVKPKFISKMSMTTNKGSMSVGDGNAEQETTLV